MASISGLVTGLDTNSIVSQLMQLERMPQQRLTSRMNLAKSASTELDSLRSAVNNIRTAASTLRSPTAWQPLQGTSSHNSVQVSTTSGMASGSLSFNVTKVATANVIYSADTVADTSAVIAAGGSVFGYSGTTNLGFGRLTATGFDVGAVSLAVTQATTAATSTATSLPEPVPLSINGTNDELVFHLNGGPAITLSLGSGLYESADDVAAAINTAIAANPAARGQVRAGVNDDGQLTLSTTAEGSDHSLAVLGGSAAAQLGWNGSEGVATGGDGIIEVNGIANVVTTSVVGTALTLNGGTGTIEATMSGPLREGTAEASQRSFGSGTLAEVVSTINSAGGLGYRAAAVNTGNGYRLQLTSSETGSAATIGIDHSMFSGFGGFAELTAGQDAEITFVGTNPYSITSSSNTFNQLLPGMNVTVSEVTTTPVTVSATQDSAKVVSAVESLVKDLSALFDRIRKSTISNVEAGTKGLLAGNMAPRRAQDELTRALLHPVGGLSAGMVGITLERNGTLKFDADAFTKAYEADPEGVQRLFVAPLGESGTSPGIVDRLNTAATNASAFGTGYLATAKEAKDNQVRQFNRQIDSYENRMELREASLRRQYASLETILGSLNNQSSWLAGQLGSLGTNGF